MLVENYPFTTTRPGDIPRPYLPITIINPENGKRLNVFALIDTGADEIALPASFAQPLGHKLESGYQKKISTGNGITISYDHTINIVVFDFSAEKIVIDFMPNLHIPLLGVKSFLNNFTLEIDYPKKYFSIT
jgi:predicted aspartyl protease